MIDVTSQFAFPRLACSATLGVPIFPHSTTVLLQWGMGEYVCSIELINSQNIIGKLLEKEKVSKTDHRDSHARLIVDRCRKRQLWKERPVT